MAKTLEELQQELEATQRLKDEYGDLRRELLRLKQDQTDTGRAAELQAEYDELGQKLSEVTSRVNLATKALSDYKSAQAAGKATQDDLISGFVKTTTSLGSLGARYQNLTKTTLPAFASGLFNGANALQNLGAVGTKVIDMFAEFGIQQDKVIAQFRANTGAGEEFNQVIRDTALANIQAGVGLEDTVAAITALKNEFTDFTYLNQEQQLEVAETTTLLNKLGFSFSTQASIIQDATQALGMDVAEAQELLLDLASTARSLGVDVNELGAQFNQNIDFIVRFGEDGQEVFEEMAVAAKALGLEMDSLIKITDSFKTFDEGARIVGRFNAILGGPFLNSIDMLNAAYEDPIEGIKMLRDGFDAAGRSIEEIGGAELEALSSALGLTTSETKKLLGATNEELEIQRMEQEQLAETAKAAQDVMTQLSNAFKQILADGKPFIDNVVIPLMEGIGSIASFLGDAESAMSSFVRVGIAAAGVAALLAAPFTGGASLASFAMLTGLGFGTAAAVNTEFGGGGGATGGGAPIPGFQTGGMITTPQAIVHPGEMLITGGEGSDVISAKKFDELIDAVKQEKGPSQVAVYLGQEKLDDMMVKSIDSPAGRRAFNPFGNG